jgi:membrane protein YdbS with pleckstrin-like domain
LAFKYIFYTVVTSTVLLSISHLFWGILFILTLILPFTLSLYAVFLLYQVWKKHDTWSWHIRFATISLFVIGSISAIVVMDDLVRYVASQDELRSFIEDHYLNGRI